jgi:hypothetical protein
VQRQPHIERDADLLREYRDEIRIAARDPVLDEADAEAGADCRELSEIAVTAQSKIGVRHRHACQEIVQKWRPPVEAY